MAPFFKLVGGLGDWSLLVCGELLAAPENGFELGMGGDAVSYFRLGSCVDGWWVGPGAVWGVGDELSFGGACK